MATELSGKSGSWTDEPLGQFGNWIETTLEKAGIRHDSDVPFMISATNEELPLFHVLAIFSAALGVTGRGMIAWTGFAHIVYWYLGLTGVQGMYSILAGMLVAQKKYAYAAFPAFLDIYTIVQDLRAENKKDKPDYFQKPTIVKILFFAAGFVLATMKYV